VSEIMAVAEHVASLCVAAEALRLPVDIPDRPELSGALAIRPADLAELQVEAREAMDETRRGGRRTWASLTCR
jgi:hypothetical protein